MFSLRAATMHASGTFQTAPMCAMSTGTSGKPRLISSIASGVTNASSSALTRIARPASRQAAQTGSSRPWSATW